ncbi:MAG TPA: hypothetical protein VFG30_06835 [Polyangiales bacterium]|nr:hypothetical protein [Polyangiales bacterium]
MSIDFGEGIDPSKPAPRGRPYPCPPQTPPEPRSMCTTRDLSCEYPKGTCVCQQDPMGTFGSLAWNCPFDAPATMCPESRPATDTPCTSLLDAADCVYSQNVACHCSGETQGWACWDPHDCPKNEPKDDAACDPVGMSCGYDETTCECFARGWQCTDAI